MGGAAYQYGEISYENHVKYSQARGYDYIIRTQPYKEYKTRDVRWHKIVLMHQALSMGYKGVFWTDGDALFTNCQLSIEDALNVTNTALSEDLYFTGDDNSVFNSGSMLFMNSEWSMKFLDRVWSLHGTKTYKDRCIHGEDQNAFMITLAGCSGQCCGYRLKQRNCTFALEHLMDQATAPHVKCH